MRETSLFEILSPSDHLVELTRGDAGDVRRPRPWQTRAGELELATAGADELGHLRLHELLVAVSVREPLAGDTLAATPPLGAGAGVRRPRGLEQVADDLLGRHPLRLARPN